MINQRAHIPLDEKCLYHYLEFHLLPPAGTFAYGVAVITSHHCRRASNPVSEIPKTRQIKQDTSHQGSVLLANLS